MSDNIPFEIQELVIKRVATVKSLLRFRSISKQWKSVIDSSEFITHHHRVNQNQSKNLLFRYFNADFEYKCVSILDDASFPQTQFYHTVPPFVKLLKYATIFDSSHRLVCLYGCIGDDKSVVVLWNPSI
jgi:hypothetical protein